MPSLQELAYSLWEGRGRPQGDDWADWFAAEALQRAATLRPAVSSGANVPALFDDDSSGCDAYRACRDHVTKEDVRLALENAWRRVWHLCPEPPAQFVRQLRQDFHARAWELFLTTVLVDAGLTLEPTSGTGPDILIRLDSGRTCWIEATTPTPGTGGNAVFQRPPGPWAGALYKEDGLLLRYRSALEDKLKKFESYRTAGIVKAEDVCLIAISQGAILDSDLHDHDLPAMARAVFPIGETVLRVVPYSDESPTVERTTRVNVFKANKQPVSTAFFLEPRTELVSGVVFAHHAIWNVAWQASDALGVIHRPKATAPLPRGTIPSRCEMWIEDDGTLAHRGRCAMHGVYAR